MNNPEKQIADSLISELSDRGQIVEGGWKAYEFIVLKGTSEIQRSECRKAFFFGAQHLFASVVAMLSPESEPTEADMERMSKLHVELRKFLEEMKTWKAKE